MEIEQHDLLLWNDSYEGLHRIRLKRNIDIMNIQHKTNSKKYDFQKQQDF